MNSERRFIIRKVWELVQLCSDQRRRCRWVNLAEFRNALDSWEIGRKEAYAALQELERGNYLLAMTRGEDDEITDITLTPPIYRCPDCRLIVASRPGLGGPSAGLSAPAREDAKARPYCLRGHITHANIFNRVIGGTTIEVLVTLRAAAAGRDTCDTRVPRARDDRDRPLQGHPGMRGCHLR
jgi:hypothetical protein